MKLTVTKNMIAVLSLAATISSCKKYEDGPALSLRSKKARVANDWKIERATDNGNDVTNNYSTYELDLSKDGSANLSSSYTFGGSVVTVSTSGVWDFVNDKDDLRLDFDNNDADVTYHILRLKEKELWLQDGGTELHLMPK